MSRDFLLVVRCGEERVVRDMVTVGNEEPGQVWMVRATGSLFPTLGTGPSGDGSAGRGFAH
jgi:hypothetical protein